MKLLELHDQFQKQTQELLASLHAHEAMCIEHERIRRENQGEVLRALDHAIAGIARLP